MAIVLEKVRFPPNAKERQCQTMFKLPHNCTHLTCLQIMLKILQAWLQQYMNCELPDLQAGFKKAKEQEIKLPTSVGSSRKQESFRKSSTSSLLTRPKPLTRWITTNWKILQEMEIPDHLTCLLRNLHAGQEATVRTRHGTTDWFQIGEGVHQSCILSPCLLNLYDSTSCKMSGWLKHNLES